MEQEQCLTDAISDDWSDSISSEPTDRRTRAKKAPAQETCVRMPKAVWKWKTWLIDDRKVDLKFRENAEIKQTPGIYIYI